MKLYIVINEARDGSPAVCLNRSNAEVIAVKWESEVIEVETVDDFVVGGVV